MSTLLHKIFLQTPEMGLAWLVIIAYFLVDFLLRNRGSVASLSTTATDKNSTMYIVGTFAIVLVSAELLTYFGVGRFVVPWLSWSALSVMLVGLVLRVVSVRQLRTGYTRTLKIETNQALVTTGLYRQIRHPGYLGTLLVWLFFGLSISNYLVFSLSALLVSFTYGYRIHTEERMLTSVFGEQYRRYRQQSWHLIPFIW